MKDAEEIIRHVLIYCIGTGNQDLWDILYPYIKDDPDIIINIQILKCFSMNLNTESMMQAQIRSLMRFCNMVNNSGKALEKIKLATENKLFTDNLGERQKWSQHVYGLLNEAIDLLEKEV